MNGHGRRAAAIVALAAVAGNAAWLLTAAVSHWTVVLASLALMAVLVAAAWYVVSRRGTVRLVAAVVGAAAGVGFVMLVVGRESFWVLVVSLLLGAISITAARFALRPRHAPAPPPPAPAARHPVLLMNPRSGGGKVERFDLVDRCMRAGIKPIVLTPGDDLLRLAETAVAEGADLIGMAGGDGSQALVASVASKHHIPLVVVPAGTRNHFALDLGIDRDDVPAALEAFRAGVDQQIDLAEVNGQVFVNNAAMGLYASIVQSEDYRNAKVQTAAAMLPDLLGPAAAGPEVTYTLPGGDQERLGQLLLVSNNPYRLHQLRGGGQRPQLDRGVLGAAALTVSKAADVQAVAALEVAGQIDRFAGWREWTPTSLEVHSARPVQIGVDGEAMVLDPPLRFVCHPGALTVRVPVAAAVRAARPDDVRVTERKTLAALWRLALGSGGD